MAQATAQIGPAWTALGDGSGRFITLEGGEGAGKSVQAAALTAHLRERGVSVVCAREPGGTPLGERIRDVLLAPAAAGELPIDPLTETLLFVAARAELVARVIAPALASDAVVVCDRFADSTRAYQGHGRGVAMEAIERLNQVATRGLQPQLTVLLDLPATAGLARTAAAGQRDRFGDEELVFHERVREGYLALAAAEPARWLVVDALQPVETVSEAIWRRVVELI